MATNNPSPRPRRLTLEALDERINPSGPFLGVAAVTDNSSAIGWVASPHPGFAFADAAADAAEYDRLAAEYLANGDLDSAIYYWRLSVGLDDQNPRVWADLGTTLIRRGTGTDREDGIYALQRAVGLNPQFGEAYAAIGFAYYAGGNITDGRAALFVAHQLGVSLDFSSLPRAGVGDVVAYIRGAQLPNGAIATSQDPAGTGTTGLAYYKVDPYFAAQAVAGLLAHAADHPGVLAVAEDHLRWHLANVKADGTIDVHYYDADGSEALPPSGPDSNDSYASLFLDALWRYHAAGGDPALFHETEAEAKIRRVAGVLEQLQQTNGLTTTFLDPARTRVLYTQDNAESYTGFRAAADLFTSVYADPVAAADYLTAAADVRNGMLSHLLDPATGLFRVGLGASVQNGPFDAPIPTDLTTWYPGTTQLVWPIVHGVIPPTGPVADAQLAALYDRWDGVDAQAWETRTDSAAVAYAAALAGHTDRAAAALATTTRGPYPTFIPSPNVQGDRAVTTVGDSGFQLLVSAAEGLTVTSTAATGPGSLREAILQANALGGGEVRFQLEAQDAGYQPALGAWVISPAAPLPALAGGVIISGLSQTGYAGDLNPSGPEVILDGVGAGAGADGFVLSGNGNVVEGVSVVRFPGHGVIVEAGSGNRVSAAAVGADGTGRTGTGNGGGVLIRAGARWSLVEGNLISSNAGVGVTLAGAGTDGNVVRANRIGTSADGSAASGNGGPGVRIEGGARWNLVDDNLVSRGLSDGVSVAGAGTVGNEVRNNRIGGNVGAGVRLDGYDAAESVVAGNWIGYAAAGGAALPNSQGGAVVGLDVPTELLSYFTDLTAPIVGQNQVSDGVRLVSTSVPVVPPPPVNQVGNDPPLIRSLVPAYFGPVPDAVTSWQRVIAEDVPGSAEVILVVNVGVGAGGADGGPIIPAGWDAAVVKRYYRQVLVDAYRKGIKLLGYVSTDYGARPQADVLSDVAAWKAMWPGVTGIFLDEQATGTPANPAAARDRLPYYVSIRADVLNRFGPTSSPESDPRVVTNPGNVGSSPDDLAAYLGSGSAVAVADIMLIYEGTNPAGYAQPAWTANYPRGRFAMLLHGVPSLAAVAGIDALRIGNYYVTDDGGDGNPWDRLPAYWSAETAWLADLNRPPAPQVSGVRVNGTTPPSAGYAAPRVTSLAVTFNTPVASIDPGAFTLARGATTMTSGGGVTVSGFGTATLTLTFTGTTGVESGSLADGVWTLTTNLSKVKNAANAAGTGTTTTNHIRRLFGDGNGDGLVNLVDFGLFGSTFGKGSASPGFNPGFDANGDGLVNLVDFGAFGQRFGKGL